MESDVKNLESEKCTSMSKMMEILISFFKKKHLPYYSLKIFIDWNGTYLLLGDESVLLKVWWFRSKGHL